MTTQESFKRRVRERMVRTGERYAAARRHLLSAPATGAGGWVSEPELSDQRVREATGLGWDEWVADIDAGPGRSASHPEIVAWVTERATFSGWWVQTVVVGYERITGIRLPGQMPDGTFTISRSRLLDADRQTVRARLLDDGGPDTLVPGLTLVPRSRPGVKRPRFTLTESGPDGDVDQGVLMLSTDAVGDRCRLTATHESIPTAAEADQWKKFWAEWLTALAEADDQDR
ncbi:hypothetical protein GCM10009718_25400 [Isoptericola halotolerans]|uniref:Activator of Hsp90 ATPase-like protein n=1 Tax=Isoptericola halotolerans TaxID=300560 RepID=A0ABX2A5F2_9MICO|nr:hypothetical protein [Isoptericola halotolerans]NOV97896.1 hypothetical protein [Isoptericola halotolerans]